MNEYLRLFPDFPRQPIAGSVESRRNAYFRAMPEICIERAYLVTKYHREHGLLGQDKISVLDKAKTYHYVQANRTPIVWHTTARERTSDGKSQPFELEDKWVDESPLAGSTTSKFKGVPLFPEFLASTIWPELYSISERAANPLYLETTKTHRAWLNDAEIHGLTGAEIPALTDPEILDLTDAEILDRLVFSHWMKDSIMERARLIHEPPNANLSSPLFEKMLYFVFFTTTKTECISHTIPSFQRVIDEGVKAVIVEANQKAKAAADAGKVDQAEFYQAIAIALDGILVYADRLAKRAREMAQAEVPATDRRRNLLEIAERYERVPRGPAKTFRDGVTALWVCWTSLHQENQNAAMSLGRLDQLLGPLLQHDLQAATATGGEQATKTALNDARDLLCHLWLKIGDHVPMMPEAGEQLYGGTGSNQAITIGGVNFNPTTSKTEDAVNEVTYLIIDSIEMMRLRDPNLNARVHLAKNDAGYLRRLGLANLRTGATPAIHNDEAIIPALIDNGLAAAHAHDYGIVGCIEPVSAGRHFGHTGSVLINLPAVLEWTLYNGRHRHTGLTDKDPIIGAQTGDPRDFATFDEFYRAFEGQIGKMIEDVVTLNNWLGLTHQAYTPTPTLSALFEGPLNKGLDVTKGGAVYNSSGVAIIGLADAADSLAAIQQVVYTDKTVDMDGLLQAMNRKFAGKKDKQLVALLKQEDRRYGRQDSPGTQLAARIAQKLAAAFGAQRNYRGGPYRVGYFSMTSHVAFGLLTGVMPNGRSAGQPFASGITPVSDTPAGLTGTLLAVASLPATALTNGVALNISFDATGNQQANLDRFEAYVKGYFQGGGAKKQKTASGGVEIQFNMMGREALCDALQHPKPELLVRVSGYTAYFKDLTPKMQKEIIARTEYGFAAGQVIPLTPSQQKVVEAGDQK